MQPIAGCLLLSSLAAVAYSQETEPRWQAGMELRGRLESPLGTDFERGRTARYYLYRARAAFGLRVSEWMRARVEGQDARAAGSGYEGNADALLHHLDLRQAYAEFGREERGWTLRVGRQELAFGDERLVGADSLWDPLGRSFDGVRARYRRSGFTVDAFGAFLVTPAAGRMARASAGERLSGAHASFERGEATWEPYLFWKSSRGWNDVVTQGVRAAGGLPGRWDYNLETALQGGREAGESIVAWAAHGELAYRPFPTDRSPRFGVEYNFASGDDRPGDGRHSTFDDLYPAGYNRFGMADPFAWRNLRTAAGALEWNLGGAWHLILGGRSIWLATVHDGLYTSGDTCLTRNAEASSSRVGSEGSAQLAFEPSARWQVYVGYALLVPGPYLMDSGRAARMHTPYVMWRYEL